MSAEPVITAQRAGRLSRPCCRARRCSAWYARTLARETWCVRHTIPCPKSAQAYWRMYRSKGARDRYAEESTSRFVRILCCPPLPLPPPPEALENDEERA